MQHVTRYYFQYVPYDNRSPKIAGHCWNTNMTGDGKGSSSVKDWLNMAQQETFANVPLGKLCRDSQQIKDIRQSANGAQSLLVLFPSTCCGTWFPFSVVRKWASKEKAIGPSVSFQWLWPSRVACVRQPPSHQHRRYTISIPAVYDIDTSSIRYQLI